MKGSWEDVCAYHLDLPVVRKARQKLKRELDAKFKFHSAAHTDDVICEAIRFACEDNLPEAELELLAIAAAFHDVGYIEGGLGHEARSADCAAAEMRAAGYDAFQIKQVKKMIMDTCLSETENGLHQKPTSELSKYLLDADLSNLGRNDFFTRLEDTISESGKDRTEVFNKALLLISRHRWLTPAGKRHREKKQRENEHELRKLLK